MAMYGALARASATNTPSLFLKARWHHIARPACRYSVQQRCYAKISSLPQPPSGKPTTAPSNQQPKKQAKRIPASKETLIPERLLIYHASVGRTTFLAIIKVITFLVGAFYCFRVVPAYVDHDKSSRDVASVVLGGIIPLMIVTYTTSPFVTHMIIHLPLSARASRQHLQRFIRNMPSTTQLTITTMSIISKPRYSTMMAGDLIPVFERFGLVNYTRNADAENASRRWYMFPAVRNFYIPEQGVAGRRRYEKTSKTEVDAWIWDAIRQKLRERAAASM